MSDAMEKYNDNATKELRYLAERCGHTAGKVHQARQRKRVALEALDLARKDESEALGHLREYHDALVRESRRIRDEAEAEPKAEPKADE